VNRRFHGGKEVICLIADGHSGTELLCGGGGKFGKQFVGPRSGIEGKKQTKEGALDMYGLADGDGGSISWGKNVIVANSTLP